LDTTPAVSATARRPSETVLLTAAAMICFAANSILCRMALARDEIDPASFTILRLLAGVAALAVLAGARRSGNLLRAGSWAAALALFAYAAAFSFAYVTLGASVGALILFGAVQATMIGVGLARGERLSWPQALAALVAAGGLVYLLLPGVTAPPALGAGLMATAGVAWGVYSLLGRRSSGQGIDPTLATAGNFLRAAPMCLALAPLAIHGHASAAGAGLAAASGALASGGGYAIWYAALKGLNASEAGVVQLTVPAIAALGGVLLLGEALSARFLIAAAMIVGGVAAVLTLRRP
jgi:drug/metabolite transporter (DMT)-like permease